MESKLSLTEFRTRLVDNTEIGSLKETLGQVRVFPIVGKPKSFYGLFDDKSFRLTTNSATSSTPYIINGKYKNINNTLKVDYVVELNNKFQLLWTRYFPIVCIVAINVFFLFFARGLRRASTIVNLFLLFMAFYSRWKEEKKRKNLEEKFLRIFEIK